MDTTAMPHASKSNITLEVFCDGGFGNRYNALVSGFALARYFGLNFIVHWPRNNWCRAGFGSIFSNSVNVWESTLTELSGTLNDATCLLHDSLGADTLRVGFQSAYASSSMEEFENTVLTGTTRIFFYPALIPNWIPQDLIRGAIIALEFNSALVDAAKTFIDENISSPYYGIHLRRTDLNVGLADHEVKMLVNRYPNEHFFVCSDDSMAEALAAVHPNVHRRDKANNIEKKNLANGWTAPTLDDDGRKYFSNIQRGAEAVLDGVVDILILGQSQIVGFSGSTFQNVARLLGQHAPITNLGLPPVIRYSALQDSIRWMKGRQLSLLQVCEFAEEMATADRLQDALELFSAALEVFSGADQFVILHNMSSYLIGAGRTRQAAIYVEAALKIIPNSPQAAMLIQRINEVPKV
jgi:hypothetical protein